MRQQKPRLNATPLGGFACLSLKDFSKGKRVGLTFPAAAILAAPSESKDGIPDRPAPDPASIR